MKLFSYDPGNTTGWALIDAKPGEREIIISGEVGGWQEFVKTFEILNRTEEIDQVIGEGWEIDAESHKKTREYDAFYILGAIQYLCFKNDIPHLIRSRNHKTFADDKKLRVLGGWWYTGGGGHCNDAYRHALAYLHELRFIKTEELLDGDS